MGAGRRRVSVADFMTGVFETALAPSEILEAVRVPRLGADARWGYYKVNRKTGEFAHAIGAVLHDPERGVCRAVVGATDARPIGLDDAGPLLDGFDRAKVFELLRERGLGADPYSLQIPAVALERAMGQAS